MRSVLVTGGTGYLGRPLIDELLRRGHRVRAVTRAGSAARLSPGAEAVMGDVTDADTLAAAAEGCDTIVQLVGTRRPGPQKAPQFRAFDLPAGLAAVDAARRADAHLVYVSVARPAPVMRAYQEVRARVEDAIVAAGLRATILRPWYILGPGHRWPLVLAPFYAIADRLPATRNAARRLGLLRLPEMLSALVRSIEQPPPGVRIVEVPEIRAMVALAG